MDNQVVSVRETLLYVLESLAGTIMAPICITAGVSWLFEMCPLSILFKLWINVMEKYVTNEA